MHSHARAKWIRLELLVLLAVRLTFRYHFRYQDRSDFGGCAGGSKMVFDDTFEVTTVSRIVAIMMVS